MDALEARKSASLSDKKAQLSESRSRRAQLYVEVYHILNGLHKSGFVTDDHHAIEDTEANKQSFVSNYLAQDSILGLLPTQVQVRPEDDSGTGSPLTSIGSPTETDNALPIPHIAITDQDGPVQGSSKDLEDPNAFKKIATLEEDGSEQDVQKIQAFKNQEHITRSAESPPSTFVSPAQLSLNPTSAPPVHSREPLPEPLDNDLHLEIPALGTDFVASLPPLPVELLRHRNLVGGLTKKKRGKDERASGLSGGMELYRMGVARAHHAGVRHMMGQGLPEARSKAIRPAKAVMTADWNVALYELQSMRAMERIEYLKSQNAWSFRQIKKQKMPPVAKTHWDYLIEEMKWLQTDFRQERRWKIGSAHVLAQAIKQYHAASEEEKSQLCIKVRPSRDLNSVNDLEDVEMEDAATEQENRDTEDKAAQPSNPQGGQTSDRNRTLRRASVSSTLTHQDSSMPENRVVGVPVQTEDGMVLPLTGSAIGYEQLALLRAPLFQQAAFATTISLSQLPLDKHLPPEAVERYRPELINGLAPDLPFYEGPQPPSAEPKDERLDRRADESSHSYSRITAVTPFMESKPLLLSTLQPAKKRKTRDEWNDMMDIGGDDFREMVNRPEMIHVAPHLFSGRRAPNPQHPTLTLHAPAAPTAAYAESRAASLDWTEAEDNTLLALTRQYSFNWYLIAEVFNGITVRVPSDLRDAWDMYDRWNKKFGPGTQGARDAEAEAKKDKLKTSRYDGTRKNMRHLSLYDAMRLLKQKRDNQPPKPLPNAPRVINLAAHDTHSLPGRPNFTAFDLSKVKGERDQQDKIMREQAANMRRQQAQQQAALQAQMAAQVQSQAHAAAAQNQQAPRLPLPPNHPLAQQQQPPRPASQSSNRTNNSSPVMNHGQVPGNAQGSPESVNLQLQNGFGSPAAPSGSPHPLNPALQFNNFANLPPQILASFTPTQQAALNQSINLSRMSQGAQGSPLPHNLMQNIAANGAINTQDPTVAALQQRMMMAIRAQKAQLQRQQQSMQAPHPEMDLQQQQS